MKIAKRRKFINRWGLYELCGVPKHYDGAIDHAVKELSKAIEEDIVKQILEKYK